MPQMNKYWIAICLFALCLPQRHAQAETYASDLGLDCVVWVAKNPYGEQYGPGASFSPDQTIQKLQTLEANPTSNAAELFSVAAQGLCYASARSVPVPPGTIAGNIAATAVLRKPDCAAAERYWKMLSPEARKALPPKSTKSWNRHCTAQAGKPSY